MTGCSILSYSSLSLLHRISKPFHRSRFPQARSKAGVCDIAGVCPTVPTSGNRFGSSGELISFDMGKALISAKSPDAAECLIPLLPGR